jgi:hypothetical protein
MGWYRRSPFRCEIDCTMRRITIFTDEDTAKTVVGWLEEQGVDFMSEDYAEPSLARRSPPNRRPAPERHEPSSGFLEPLKKTGRRTLRQMIKVWLKEAECLNREQLRGLAQDAGFNPARVKDTVRRMIKAEEIEESLLSGDLNLFTEGQ